MKIKDFFIKYISKNKRTIFSTTLAMVITTIVVVGGVNYLKSNPNPTLAFTPAVASVNSVDVLDAAEGASVETPEIVSYDVAGTYPDTITYVTGTVNADGVVIENATYENLEIAASVGEGSVTLRDVTVTGTLTVNGGGTASLHIEGAQIANLVENDTDCHIVVDKATAIKGMTIPNSVLVDIYGTVSTLSIVPSTLKDMVKWEIGVHTYKNSQIGYLNLKAPLALNAYRGTILRGEPAETQTPTTTPSAKANTAKVTTNASNGSSSNNMNNNSNSNNSSTNNNSKTTDNNKICNHNWVLKGVVTTTIVDTPEQITSKEINEYNENVIYVCSDKKTFNDKSDCEQYCLFNIGVSYKTYNPGEYVIGTRTENTVVPAVTHDEKDYSNAYYECSICGEIKPYQ